MAYFKQTAMTVKMIILNNERGYIQCIPFLSVYNCKSHTLDLFNDHSLDELFISIVTLKSLSRCRISGVDGAKLPVNTKKPVAAFYC